MKKIIKYPFSDKWELIHYVSEGFREEHEGWGTLGDGTFYRGKLHWYDNYTFGRSLHFLGVYRGRSAVTFLWEDTNAKKFPMFIRDMAEVLQKAEIKQGWTNLCEWTFVKRGSNYGITLVGK